MEKIQLVSFMASWCGACKAQAPILNEIERDFGDRVEIIKVDVNDNRDYARELSIDATPTLFILKNDKVFKKYIGLTDRNELESAINNAIMFQ